MKHNGIVYAYVGVIGGGKSYQANKRASILQKRGYPVIMSDFSDGIRNTCLKVFGCDEVNMNPVSPFYSNWKNETQRVKVPIGDSIAWVPISGREILKNIGEHLKTLAGNGVWANWSRNDVLNRASYLTKGELEECNIIFGSVRFPVEAQAVFSTASSLGKQVRFIFCDYHSDTYQLTDHISEKFAQEFLKLGCKDGDDITKLVFEKMNM